MGTGERGQILPGLLVVLLAVLAVGMLMFQVGKAAVLRSDAQTAADAAALAGAQEIRRQLILQWATTGTTSIELVSRPLVRARMREYAKRNDATLIDSSVVIQGVDVKAAVTTDDEVGREARKIGREDGKGEGGREGRGARPGPHRADARPRRRRLDRASGGWRRGRRLRSRPEPLREGLEGARQGHRHERPDLRRPRRARPGPPEARLRRRRERRLRARGEP